MPNRGECFACKRVGQCLETNYQKVYWGFTCALFEGISEPEHQARVDMKQRYGDSYTIRALLDRPEEGKLQDG